MLYITRKKGESIIVNNTIKIEVVEIMGNKVKIGCSFPNDASILREELYLKIMAQNKSSSNIEKIDDLGALLADIGTASSENDKGK